MSTTAKKKTVFYPLLRIPRSGALINPLQNDQVLKAYVNLFLRVLKPMCLLRVQKGSVQETKRIEEIVVALTTYINELDASYNGHHLLLILTDCVRFLKDSRVTPEEFTRTSNHAIQDTVKQFMLSTESHGYNFSGPYVYYYPPDLSTEIKPQKQMRALALYQYNHIANILQTMVAFSQAGNYSIQLSRAQV